MTSLTPNHEGQSFELATVQSPDVFQLTNLKYLESKKEMLVEFTNSQTSFNQRYSFFPKVCIPSQGLTTELIQNLLSAYSKNAFFLEAMPKGIMKIVCKTFTDLQKITNLLKYSLKVKPVVLRPERQFLIEKKWDYFQSFTRNNQTVTGLQQRALPNIRSALFAEPLQETLKALLKKDKNAASHLLKQMAYSAVLKVPMEEIPEKKSVILEYMLENIFQKHEFALPLQIRETVNNRKPWFKIFPEFIELDFSFTWLDLFKFTSMNLGVDSLDCECCVPKTLYDHHVSPASLVDIEILQEGLFFESLDEGFAEHFHTTQAKKQTREKMQREWNLFYIPVGPFHSGNITSIPVIDALQLQREEKVRILKKKTMHWFCKQQASFYSQEMGELFSLHTALEQKVIEKEKQCMQEHRLHASELLEQDLEYLYFTTFKESIQEIMSFLPQHLAYENSNFYSFNLRKAMKTLQKHTLKEFQSFSSKKGMKSMYSFQGRAYVKSKHALFLAKKFSEQEKIPMPIVKNAQRKL